jgi:branched-chain amino acid transport system ATP-binding protein
VFTSLVQIRASGVGVLLVEQNAKQSLAIADRGYVMENGRIAGHGSAKALADDASVRRAYLGGAYARSAVA